MTHDTKKYHSDNLRIFRAIYEAQNADNARMLEIWFCDKLL